MASMAIITTSNMFIIGMTQRFAVKRLNLAAKLRGEDSFRRATQLMWSGFHDEISYFSGNHSDFSMTVQMFVVMAVLVALVYATDDMDSIDVMFVSCVKECSNWKTLLPLDCVDYCNDLMDKLEDDEAQTEPSNNNIEESTDDEIDNMDPEEYFVCLYECSMENFQDPDAKNDCLAACDKFSDAELNNEFDNALSESKDSGASIMGVNDYVDYLACTKVCRVKHLLDSKKKRRCLKVCDKLKDIPIL